MIAISGFVNFDEGFLRDLFGVGQIARGTQTEADDRFLPSTHQIIQREIVSFA